MQVIHKPIKSHYELFCLALILLLALQFRLVPISRGLGQDELYTSIHFVDAGSIWNIMSTNRAFNNHVGYSVMAHFSEILFGRSESALRFPALLLGLMGVGFFFMFSRLVLAPSAALVATLALAVSPPDVIWSMTARGYSSLILSSILSSYLYFRLLRRPNRIHAVCLVAVSTFGIYVHLYSAFVTLVQVVVFARLLTSHRFALRLKFNVQTARDSRRTLSLCFFAIAGLTLVCHLPLYRDLLDDLTGRGRGNFNPAFPWLVLQALTGTHSTLIIFLFMAVSILGYLSLQRSHPLEMNYFAWLLFASLALMWFARPFDLYPRFFVYWLPFYLVLFVAGVYSMWQLSFGSHKEVLLYLSRTVSIAVSAVVLMNWTTNWPNYIPNEGYREASSAVLAGADESVMLCVIGGARAVWKYYIKRPLVMPLSLAEIQKIGKGYKEVRCVYYEASWQDPHQTEIAQFLFRHASWSKLNDVTFFIYRIPVQVPSAVQSFPAPARPNA